VRVVATLKLPGRLGELAIPIEARRLVVRAPLRIVAAPLLPAPPFVGRVSISLMQEPYVSLELPLCGKLDATSLPGVAWGIERAVRAGAAAALLYPRSLTLDLAPGGGVAPPPLGMITVTLNRIEARTRSPPASARPHRRPHSKPPLQPLTSFLAAAA
jgi:Ca2+-dependent lipid-binding protein